MVATLVRGGTEERVSWCWGNMVEEDSVHLVGGFLGWTDKPYLSHTCYGKEVGCP